MLAQATGQSCSLSHRGLPGIYGTRLERPGICQGLANASSPFLSLPPQHALGGCHQPLLPPCSTQTYTRPPALPASSHEPVGAPQDAPSAPQAPRAPAELSSQAGSAAAPPSETKRGREELRLPNRSSSLPALWERRSASVAPAPLLRGGSGLAARWERCRCSQNGDCAPKRAPGTVTGEISEMRWGVSAPSQHPAPSGAERVAGREGPGATSSRPAELLAAGRAAQLARSFNRQLSRQLEAGAGFLLHEPCS